MSCATRTDPLRPSVPLPWRTLPYNFRSPAYMQPVTQLVRVGMAPGYAASSEAPLGEPVPVPARRWYCHDRRHPPWLYQGPPTPPPPPTRAKTAPACRWACCQPACLMKKTGEDVGTGYSRPYL